MAITIRKIPCPVGATLMKTGQTTSYRTGDDGDIEAGRDVDFFTLASNNPFGNTNRFTDELGGTAYANDIVIDWSTYNGSTVLGYCRRLVSSGGVFDFTWDNAVDVAAAFTKGTFTSGWRLWNRNECNNIVNAETPGGFNYAPFDNPAGELVGQNIWTSSTLKIGTTSAWFTQFYGRVDYSQKTNLKRVIAVRTFTVTGTTLT